MKTLLVVRPDARSKPGGDLVHAERTATALRALGAQADLVATEAPDPRGYDVAHVFGIFDPDIAEPQVDAVRAANVPLVISPIWWDRTALFRLSPLVERALSRPRPGREGVDKRFAELRRIEPKLVSKPGRGALRHVARQAALLRRCDVALTASVIESFACARFLGTDSVPYVVAPYGLDADAFAATFSPQREGVVCVGRIEPLKNQATLLCALHDLDVDVTLVGSARDTGYVGICRTLATRRVERAARACRGARAAVVGRSAGLRLTRSGGARRARRRRRTRFGT